MPEHSAPGRPQVECGPQQELAGEDRPKYTPARTTRIRRPQQAALRQEALPAPQGERVEDQQHTAGQGEGPRPKRRRSRTRPRHRGPSSPARRRRRRGGLEPQPAGEQSDRRAGGDPLEGHGLGPGDGEARRDRLLPILPRLVQAREGPEPAIADGHQPGEGPLLGLTQQELADCQQNTLRKLAIGQAAVPLSRSLQYREESWSETRESSMARVYRGCVEKMVVEGEQHHVGQ